MAQETVVLIDTSSWIEALRKRGNPDIQTRVSALLLDGRAACCDLVLLELWNGARGDYERKKLAQLEREIPSLPTTPEVWSLARELARKCRSAGKTVPCADLLIASCALMHGAEIEHCDEHFDEILRIHPQS